MNVLHVHSGNLYGGVETFLVTLGRSRAATNMQMTAALSFDARLADELREQRVPVHLLGEVRLRRPDSVLRARQALKALLAQGRFDAAVCHQAWPHAIFGPVIKTAGLPLVAWVHMPQTGRHWLERLASRVEPDCTVCNSRFTASTAIPASSRVEIVYPPVIDRQPNLHSRSAVRNEFRTGADDVVIAQVSRMERLKGHQVLIDALATLRDLSGWTCWIIGGAQRQHEARYVESLKRSADAHGIFDRIRFVGHRSDVAEVLSAVDIFCQPNVEPEGFGLTYVEAMFAGLPVVTSAIGGAIEIVDLSCGRLLPPADVPSLRSTLAELIANRSLRERLGAAGRARAKLLCDADAQTRAIAALLSQVAANAGAARTH